MNEEQKEKAAPEVCGGCGKRLGLARIAWRSFTSSPMVLVVLLRRQAN